MKNLVGTTEKTNRNDGEVIEKIQKSCGLPKYAPYCNAMIYYSFAEAVEMLNLSVSEIPIPKQGLAQGTFKYAKKHGRMTPYIPQIGDMFVWYKRGAGYGHIGRIVVIGSFGWVHVIEGNTGNGKGKQGIFIKKRNLLNPLDKLLYVMGLVGIHSDIP